ncbi:c-type cytochrome [Massilia sp. TN1-12]|uniref:c-type cytochrome n=1 Tax=Massilia paldalensis TaxID=3377675 RepID=UPI0038511D30
MRTWITNLIAIALIACAGRSAAQGVDAATLARGKYLATASDCMACHTAHKGQPMAGGLVLSSPGGDIVSTNITPSKRYGIGNYTERQFADALRRGIRADGQPLYPAMPYTAYAALSDADVHALYAYFMQGVPAVERETTPTALPFPMGVRASMKVWNALFLDEQPLKPEAGRSPEWLRGRYLAEGAAHCSTCHTPRGALMQEKKELAMAGSQVGPWYAPNITSHPTAGIGSWSEAELVQYLRSGRVEGKAQAAGSMAEAIGYSFSRLEEADLKAIAVYVKSLPPVDAGEGKGQATARFGQGKPGNALADIRGKGYAAGMQGQHMGAQVYSANCASCHGASGEGSADGYYPSLFHNSATVSKNNLVATILLGVDRETQDGHVFMPPFGAQPNALNHLSNDEVAALANYLQVRFGSGAPTVKADDVASIRAGGPRSHLLLVARLGMAAGALLVVVLAVLVVRRRRASRGAR